MLNNCPICFHELKLIKNTIFCDKNTVEGHPHYTIQLSFLSKPDRLFEKFKFFTHKVDRRINMTIIKYGEIFEFDRCLKINSFKSLKQLKQILCLK